MAEPKKPTRLFLVRHGQVVSQGQKTFLGFTDWGLSDQGKKQVQALARYLKAFPLDRAYASDLKRAITSAELLCRSRSLTPIPYPEFREMDMGAWDGKSWAEIKKQYPETPPVNFSDLKKFRFPEGENWSQFRSRVLRRLKKVLEEDQGKEILLAAHAGVNRIILAQALGLRFRNMFFMDQAYACLNIIEYHRRFAVVKLMNATYYL